MNAELESNAVGTETAAFRWEQKLPEKDPADELQNKTEIKKHKLTEGLARFNVPYREEETFEQNAGRNRILNYLSDKGLLRLENGSLILDDRQVKSFLGRARDGGNSSMRFFRKNAISALQGIKGYTAQDAESEDYRQGRLDRREFFALPKTINELVDTYPERAKDSIFKPWDRFYRGSWDKPITLASGEQTNPGELAMASILIERLQAKRIDGQLTILDPQTKQREKFSARKFPKQTGINPNIQDGGKKRAVFNASPVDYAHTYLPNLIEKGLLKDQDFRSMAGKRIVEKYNIADKPVNHKGFTYVNRVKYRVAQQLNGKLYVAGSEYTQEIDPLTTKIRVLDPRQAGIIDTSHKKERLLYIFDLLNEEELTMKRTQFETKFEGEHGKRPESSRTSSDTVISTEEMISRLRPYRIGEFILQRADESHDDYNDRIAQLNDVKLVTKTFKKLFQEAELGTHNLPWNEQLVLANAMLEEKSREKLLKFAQNYGSDGVRALVSLDYDKHLKTAIFDIAEKLPEQARLIYKEYAQLNEAALSLAKAIKNSQFLQEINASENFIDTFSQQMAEAIMRRAKDILYTAQSLAVNNKAEAELYDSRKITSSDPNEIIQALRIYREAVSKLNNLLLPPNAARFEFELIQKQIEQLPNSYEFALRDQETGEESFMMIQFREYGAPLGEHNQHIEFDGEARINFLFADQPIITNISDPVRQNALSLRIDREGKVREGDRIIENDPMAQNGEVSLEVGGYGDDNDKSPNSVIGRVVSIGNALAVANQRSEETKYPQYYHNRESFAQELGEKENFSTMVRFLQQKIDQRFATQSERPFAGALDSWRLSEQAQKAA